MYAFFDAFGHFKMLCQLARGDLFYQYLFQKPHPKRKRGQSCQWEQRHSWGHVQSSWRKTLTCWPPACLPPILRGRHAGCWRPSVWMWAEHPPGALGWLPGWHWQHWWKALRCGSWCDGEGAHSRVGVVFPCWDPHSSENFRKKAQRSSHSLVLCAYYPLCLNEWARWLV